MKTQYQVDAVCPNPRCLSTNFSILRRQQIDKTKTSGESYQISKVVCPTCKNLGEVTAIKELKNKHQEAMK